MNSSLVSYVSAPSSPSSSAGVYHSSQQQTSSPQSLNQALIQHGGKIMDILDSLGQSVHGLELPHLIVVGDESNGKSSVLERLAMLPILPRKQQMCTRMPVEVRMRHKSSNEMKQFCAENSLVYSPLNGYARMSWVKQNGQVESSPFMSDFKEIETAVEKSMANITNSKGISRDKLTIEITSEAVPNLVMVDLPGIVSGIRPGEPTDLEAQTKALIEEYLRQEHVLILLIVDGTSRIRNSQACGLIQKHKKEKQTIGVITKADLCGSVLDDPSRRDPFFRLRQRLRQESDDTISLKPHGYVAVFNRDSRDSSELHHAAEIEDCWFDENIPGLRQEGLAGGNSLVVKICKLMAEYTVNHWAPKALVSCQNIRSQLVLELNNLGSPPELTENYLSSLLFCVTRLTGVKFSTFSSTSCSFGSVSSPSSTTSISSFASFASSASSLLKFGSTSSTSIGLPSFTFGTPNTSNTTDSNGWKCTCCEEINPVSSLTCLVCLVPNPKTTIKPSSSFTFGTPLTSAVSSSTSTSTSTSTTNFYNEIQKALKSTSTTILNDYQQSLKKLHEVLPYHNSECFKADSYIIIDNFLGFLGELFLMFSKYSDSISNSVLEILKKTLQNHQELPYRLCRFPKLIDSIIDKVFHSMKAEKFQAIPLISQSFENFLLSHTRNQPIPMEKIIEFFWMTKVFVPSSRKLAVKDFLNEPLELLLTEVSESGRSRQELENLIANIDQAVIVIKELK